MLFVKYYWGNARLELVVEPFIEALWPSLEKVFNPSSIDESDGPICEETDAVLSNFVTEKLQLKTVSSDFDSDSKYYTEFEKALRGSDDYTWRNLSVTVPPLQQPYLNVELQEVGVIVLNDTVKLFLV